MKKNVLLFVVCIVLLVLGFISHANRTPQLKTPGGVYETITARTEEERNKGLSYREKLDKNSVMVFIFDTPDYHGIWMKEMLFNIDIVYVDSDWVVINYFDDVSPRTYPTIFYPEKPASYVVEMNSGARAKSGIDKNTKLYYK